MFGGILFVRKPLGKVPWKSGFQLPSVSHGKIYPGPPSVPRIAVLGKGVLDIFPSKPPHPLMERYPAPVEVGSLCYDLPGFSTIYQVFFSPDF